MEDNRPYMQNRYRDGGAYAGGGAYGGGVYGGGAYGGVGGGVYGAPRQIDDQQFFRPPVPAYRGGIQVIFT